MLIAGIDEAGRGPCLGPMVMAVTTIQKKDEEKLIELGVKDSKQLSAAERERQFPEIKGIVREYASAKIGASELDKLMARNSLNEIEAMRAGELLNALKKKPDVVYIDSPDVVSENFAKRIRRYISFDCTLKSEHKADENYPIVGAASVIAKVERDNEIKAISKEYGKIGSGYASDENTINFIRNYLLEYNSLPPFARKAWMTSQRLVDERFQKKLGDC